MTAVIEALLCVLIVTGTMLTVLADDPKPRTKRVLFFESKSCQPCKLAKREIDPWMRASGWTLGTTNDNHVQYVDIESTEGQLLASRFHVETLPAFVLIDDGKDLARRTGYATDKPESVRRTVIIDIWK